MKKMLRYAGILLVICAVALFIIAGVVEEAAQPTKVSTGIVVNGTYKELNSGYMGGNAKAVKEMGWLKGISALSGIMGAGAIAGSFVVKKEEEPQY